MVIKIINWNIKMVLLSIFSWGIYIYISKQTAQMALCWAMWIYGQSFLLLWNGLAIPSLRWTEPAVVTLCGLRPKPTTPLTTFFSSFAVSIDLILCRLYVLWFIYSVTLQKIFVVWSIFLCHFLSCQKKKRHVVKKLTYYLLANVDFNSLC